MARTAPAKTTPKAKPVEQPVEEQPKKEVKKKTSEPAPVQVPAPVSTPVEVEEAPQVAGSEATYAAINNELVLALQKSINSMKDALKTVRTLKTVHEKELKENKVVKKAPKRPRSTNAGFAAPTKITPQLAKYLGVSSDMLSRTEAVKMIHEKIKSNNLQDQEDKRTIVYTKDKELQKLLNLPAAFENHVNKKTGEKDSKLTYFNLQRYISPHFLKVASQ